MSLVDAQVVQQGDRYFVKHGDDAGLYVEFSIEAVQNEHKSTEAGRPIFEDKEYITIRIAGDNKTVRRRPVSLKWKGDVPPDSERWPRQWQAFKNQQTQTVEGTPLTEWGMITKSDAMSMKALNIHTVEQLAELGENNMQWMGARMMRDKAKAWIAQSQGNAGLSKLQAENETLRNDLEALKNQMAALIDAKPELAEKRKPGRPAKEVTNVENIS